MARLLVIEDQPNDLRIAAETARSAGITDVEARTSSQAAINYLEKGLRQELPLPDGIVLDLDLGYESGYELLRFWHSTPELKKIPMIVWTLLGEEQREICNLFRVNHFVSKWEGVAAFREVLSKVSGNHFAPKARFES
jgi:CheY-like chemotaxis protein